MIKIKIDNREVELAEGRTLIEVLREQGIDVPSLCYMKELPGFTSCMLCLVKERSSGKLIPSCSLKAQEGMDIISEDEEVSEARRVALELLLSEHVGDCEAPCQISCPAHMDIPLMNRLLAQGKFDEALEVVRRDIALPSVLGRICTAPCEGACRRRPMDGAVSICMLKRYAGDVGTSPVLKEKSTGKKVAVIGAGPAGLAAAYYLALRGHAVKLLDRNAEAGGSLLKETTVEDLPREVLQREVEHILSCGVEFAPGIQVDKEGFEKLSREYDAVVICSGKGESGVREWGLPVQTKGLEVDVQTYRVENRNVFVVGSALKPARLAIRTLGQGKEVVFSVDQLLRGETVKGEPFRFNSRFGKLLPAEYSEYLKESFDGKRNEAHSKAEGLSREQVMEEAARCLHCDCRDLEHCKLRLYADSCGATQKRFRSEERHLVTKSLQHESVIYEPSKCIKCGICVRLTEKHKEKYGMTFIGRGFDVVVSAPFNEEMGSALRKVAKEVALACPTGAICLKNPED